MTENMTPLDWHVYRLLEEKTLGTSNSVTQREIYESCLKAGYRVSWNERQNQHNDHCRWLADVCKRINGSLEVDKMVGHPDHKWRYRLLSMDEAVELAATFEARGKIALARKGAIMAKIKRDGQGKLFSNQGVPITSKRKAKEFYEAFNEILEELKGD